MIEFITREDSNVEYLLGAGIIAFALYAAFRLAMIYFFPGDTR